jgi:hypothetical protein
MGITITKTSAQSFNVDTGTITADLRPIADECRLDGSELRTYYDGRSIHIVPQIRIALGPVSFAKVSAMAVGETITFGV